MTEQQVKKDEQKPYKEAQKINKEQKDKHATVENGEVKVQDVLKG